MTPDFPFLDSKIVIQLEEIEKLDIRLIPPFLKIFFIGSDKSSFLLYSQGMIRGITKGHMQLIHELEY